MPLETPATGSDTPAAVTKKRQRFRARGAKIITAILTRVDRLEALAAVQSYEVAKDDLVTMETALHDRLDAAFSTLGNAADRGSPKTPATAAFSFDETGA